MHSTNDGSAPKTFGEGESSPRGDYSRASADFTCRQNVEGYSATDHDTYRRLFVRQRTLLEGLACEEFIQAVGELGLPESIPNFELISERLFRATGWQIVAVPGLIPEVAFFSLLAKRRFPVTDWVRRPEEFDFIIEPDLFHDLFGHVPLLFVKSFADYMQAYGEGGLKAGRLGACELLARLYWYTVEFGLIATSEGLRAFGAGILSSAAELRHSVLADNTIRIAFDLERTMLTRYRIDSVQSTYMVIRSFDELFIATAPDLSPVYERVLQRQRLGRDIWAGEILPDEERLSPDV